MQLTFNAVLVREQDDDTPDQPDFYTIGYEKRTIRDFLDTLKAHGITAVVDVRKNPYSRKKWFSAEELMRALASVDIDYVSTDYLGTPVKLRRSFLRGEIGWEEFREKYLEEVKPDVTELMLFTQEGTPVLMCYERDWRRCHRRILAELMEEQGLRCQHL